MAKILLLSDTHSCIDEKILKYVKQADEVWHAGDIGNIAVVTAIEKLKPLRAVYGNIDAKNIRTLFKEDAIFEIEGIKVWITHIAGYPNKYTKRITEGLKNIQPTVFICGHSHILKVQYSKKFKVLHLNPGAAGNYGIHKVRTMLRFEITNGTIKNMEVIELANRG